MKRWLKSHLLKYRDKKPWEFCWKITLEAFFVTLIFAALLLFIVGDKRSDIDSIMTGGAAKIIIVIGIILPIIETILLQVFPVFLARLFKATFLIQVFVAWIPFALLHFEAGIGVGVCAGLIRGFYFAFTYTHWRQISRWRALLITSLSHIMHNVAVLILLLITGYFIGGT